MESKIDKSSENKEIEGNRHLAILNERSEAVEEILSTKRGFVEKWGPIFFLLMLISFISTTYFVRYPEVLETNAYITAVNAPKELMSFEGGRLIKLFVQNNGFVKKGQVIGLFESAAEHSEVLELSTQIDSAIELLKTGNYATLSSHFVRDFANLGELQQRYETFLISLEIFKDYAPNRNPIRGRNLFYNDLKSLSMIRREEIERQKALTLDELKIGERSLAIAEKLYKERILTLDEYKTEVKQLLGNKLRLPISNSPSISDDLLKLKELSDVGPVDFQSLQQKIIFHKEIQLIKGFVDDWKKKFVLQAPIDGHVSLIIPFQQYQYIRQGKLIGYVNPENSQFYAHAYLKQQNFGKIRSGLKVQMRIDAYPYQENGFVEGTLDYISDVATDSGFLATIKFEKGMCTTNNTQIPFRIGLTARALIVTEHVRLSDRLFYGIKKLITVNSK